MSKRKIENNFRLTALAKLQQYLTTEYGDVLKVPTTKGITKNSYALVVPVVDGEGNEDYLKFEITTPRPPRSGGEYDPYTLSAEMETQEDE